MTIDLCLFATDTVSIRRAIAAGITAFVVDWEDRTGSLERSVAVERPVGPDDEDDLRRVSDFPRTRRICRINPYGENTQGEVDRAIAAGATHVLLPMVDGVSEVEDFIGIVSGRASPGIMVETDAACQEAENIGRLPLDFVYVGLIDLAITDMKATSSVPWPTEQPTIFVAVLSAPNSVSAG